MGVLVGVQNCMMGKQLDVYKNTLNEHAAFELVKYVCMPTKKDVWGLKT